MKYRQFHDAGVADTFDAYPGKLRSRLLVLREMIFRIAEGAYEIGQIEETLKWGEPSYLTHAPKTGTTIRLSDVGGHDDRYAMSVHCQTSLLADFRAVYPELKYDGDRSLVFDIAARLPRKTVEHFIFSALTYHYRKKRGLGI